VEYRYPDHPYGRPGNGTLESVARITVDDMKSNLRHVFTRDTLKIGVVGDIDLATTGRLIDRALVCPPRPSCRSFRVTPQGIGRHRGRPRCPASRRDVWWPWIKRSDPDFMAAYIVNHILGGGLPRHGSIGKCAKALPCLRGLTGVSWFYHTRHHGRHRDPQRRDT
jgi:zinc protease